MSEALIAESIAKWGHAQCEVAVFGTGRPPVIAAMIDELCRQNLGSTPREALFYAASVGCVAGVGLDDGSRVVIKAFQPRWARPFLQSVRDAQAHLARTGFPCPRPLAGPASLGRGLALVESFLPDAGLVAIEPEMIAVSAAGLAEQVRRCEPLDLPGLRDHPLNAPPSSLYPEPHSPVFDFVATAAGAEWIDELAVRAKRMREGDVGALVVAHCDWSARNVRLSSDRVLAVYDWDSLALVPESTAVGQAAVTWRSTGEPGEEAPSVAEIVRFVRCYESARGRDFTRAEWTAIGGAAVWVLAYASRCEHAIDPGARLHRRARPRLRADGEALLALAP